MSALEGRWVLVRAALLAGLGALVAGNPYLERHAPVDVEALAEQVAREQDHITAVELAEWVRAGRPGLRVVDVRSQQEFDQDHLPFAEHVPLEALARTRFARTDVIVLVSRGGTHAAQAWVLLRALGHSQAYFLTGGMDEWETEILAPVLGASSAHEALTERAELSRYFGGLPRVGVSPAAPRRRRGC